jgi:hypothetical protein
MGGGGKLRELSLGTICSENIEVLAGGVGGVREETASGRARTSFWTTGPFVEPDIGSGGVTSGILYEASKAADSASYEA